MSLSTIPASANAAGDQAAVDLAVLRAEIDRVDDATHGLLMERAALVGRLAASGHKGAVALRPGREAAILRRLLARHEGALPRSGLVRVWRELFAASVAMQGSHVIAVCEADAGAAFTQCAREHFGALTPLRIHRSPAQAIAEVSAGSAAAAVLPLPTGDEPPRGAWWTALLQRDEPRIHVIARLPFWSARPEGSPQVEALVISTVPPDPSGQDFSLIGLELALEVSRARLMATLASAGLKPEAVVLRRDPGAPVAHALVEIEGLLADDDARLVSLAGVLQRPVVLGGYALREAGGDAP